MALPQCFGTHALDHARPVEETLLQKQWQKVQSHIEWHAGRFLGNNPTAADDRIIRTYGTWHAHFNAHFKRISTALQQKLLVAWLC
jgi:hypothetical protein